MLKACRLYNVFGSSAIHGIYAQFLAQAAIHNNGKKIGLLRGAGTRFSTWFYAMMRVLHHKDTLKSTIHTLKFRDLVKNDKIRGAVMDIENEVFFKAFVHFAACCIPCTKDASLLRQEQASNGQDFFSLAQDYSGPREVGRILE